MFKSKNPGLAIVETILVIAISGVMFVVVIGLFATRKRTQSDDGARQVLSIIAKVRNEAQSGKGPTTDAGKNLLKCNDSTASTCSSSNVIFGEAIKFYSKTVSGKTTTYLYVYKLMENRKSGLITAYEKTQIDMPGNLFIFAPGGTAASQDLAPTDGGDLLDGSVAPDSCSVFSTCYEDTTIIGSRLSPINTLPLDVRSTESISLVFLNRTGESYAFTMSNPSPINDRDKYSSTGPYKVTPDASIKAQYTSNRQGRLRLALFAAGPGNTLTAQANSATARYYINFDLSVPNNQSLEVVQ